MLPSWQCVRGTLRSRLDSLKLISNPTQTTLAFTCGKVAHLRQIELKWKKEYRECCNQLARSVSSHAERTMCWRTNVAYSGGQRKIARRFIRDVKDFHWVGLRHCKCVFLGIHSKTVHRKHSGIQLVRTSQEYARLCELNRFCTLAALLNSFKNFFGLWLLHKGNRWQRTFLSWLSLEKLSPLTQSQSLELLLASCLGGREIGFVSSKWVFWGFFLSLSIGSFQKGQVRKLEFW